MRSWVFLSCCREWVLRGGSWCSLSQLLALVGQPFNFAHRPVLVGIGRVECLIRPCRGGTLASCGSASTAPGWRASRRRSSTRRATRRPRRKAWRRSVMGRMAGGCRLEFAECHFAIAVGIHLGESLLCNRLRIGQREADTLWRQLDDGGSQFSFGDVALVGDIDLLERLFRLQGGGAAALPMPLVGGMTMLCTSFSCRGRRAPSAPVCRMGRTRWRTVYGLVVLTVTVAACWGSQTCGLPSNA